MAEESDKTRTVINNSESESDTVTDTSVSRVSEYQQKLNTLWEDLMQLKEQSAQLDEQLKLDNEKLKKNAKILKAYHANHHDLRKNHGIAEKPQSEKRTKKKPDNLGRALTKNNDQGTSKKGL